MNTITDEKQLLNFINMLHCIYFQDVGMVAMEEAMASASRPVIAPKTRGSDIFSQPAQKTPAQTVLCGRLSRLRALLRQPEHPAGLDEVRVFDRRRIRLDDVGVFGAMALAVMHFGNLPQSVALFHRVHH